MSVEENKALCCRVYEEIDSPVGQKRTSQYVLNVFPDPRFHIGDMITEGDRVVCRAIVRGTHKGEYMGITPTGMPFSVTEIEINTNNRLSITTLVDAGRNTGASEPLLNVISGGYWRSL